MDRETVITHLQIIHTWAEFACERDLQFFTKKHLEDIAEWSSDAIELLKEQEAMKECLKKKCVICPHCANCDVDENGLLKEQDAVMPKYNARTNWYECGNCHYSMTSGMHCRSELIPATKVRYCANCGFPANWGGR